MLFKLEIDEKTCSLFNIDFNFKELLTILLNQLQKPIKTTNKITNKLSKKQIIDYLDQYKYYLDISNKTINKFKLLIRIMPLKLINNIFYWLVINYINAKYFSPTFIIFLLLITTINDFKSYKLDLVIKFLYYSSRFKLMRKFIRLNKHYSSINDFYLINSTKLDNIANYLENSKKYDNIYLRLLASMVINNYNRDHYLQKLISLSLIYRDPFYLQYVHYLNTLEFYCSNKPFFCIIDQEEYYLGFKLECDHIYGPNIFKWLGKNALCPLCYAALYRDTSPFTDYIYYGELNYVMEKIVNIYINIQLCLVFILISIIKYCDKRLLNGKIFSNYFEKIILNREINKDCFYIRVNYIFIFTFWILIYLLSIVLLKYIFT